MEENQNPQPRGDRRTDVCTHNDADRLRQIQHPGIDKADHHNCRRRRALNHCRDEGSYQNCRQPVLRQKTHQPLHLSARKMLQAIRHYMHAV